MESSAKKFVVVVYVALLIQLVGRYYSPHFLIWGHFVALKFVLRITLPFLLARFYLQTSWEDFGLRWPQLTKKYMLGLLTLMVVLPMALTLIKLDSDYINFYKQIFPGRMPEEMTRFTLFTLSTVLSWEFLHRGFLLFHLKKILETSFHGLSSSFAAAVSVSVVTIFETVYHLMKPDIEAFGMLVGSPFLSLIALRTKSLLIPLLIHLYIELWFFLYISE